MFSSYVSYVCLPEGGVRVFVVVHTLERLAGVSHPHICFWCCFRRCSCDVANALDTKVTPDKGEKKKTQLSSVQNPVIIFLWLVNVDSHNEWLRSLI